MEIIKTKALSYDYIESDENDKVVSVQHALSDININIQQGSFTAVLGANGSGKSTLAKQFNAILAPTMGEVVVLDMSTTDESSILKIRESVGMVFQNPDNQIIGNVVEEDVGFGPENIGVPSETIVSRVADSLEDVGMSEYAKASPNLLSGGQKQRVAIAGVLAMRPKCIILDESTAMLDPKGRKEVIATAHKLNKQEGITIVLITHYMEEVVDADHVIVMDASRVLMEGTPREIFAHARQLEEIGLTSPLITQLAIKLREAGLDIDECILTEDEMVEKLMEVDRKK